MKRTRLAMSAMAMSLVLTLAACGSTSGGDVATDPDDAATESAETASGAPGDTPADTPAASPSPSSTESTEQPTGTPDAGEGSGESGEEGTGDATAPADEAGATQLRISVLASEGAERTTYTLTCDPPGGDHPNPEAACAALAEANDPFAPVPKDRMCTQQYGGPQTATINGTYQGNMIMASFKRTDGCEIDRWNTLAAVFAVSGGDPSV
jgi:hypothetical protein